MPARLRKAIKPKRPSPNMGSLQMTPRERPRGVKPRMRNPQKKSTRPLRHVIVMVVGPPHKNEEKKKSPDPA